MNRRWSPHAGGRRGGRLWRGLRVSVAMAVGAAGVDAVRWNRLWVDRPVLGGVLGDDVRQAAREGGRRLGASALVRRKYVKALEVGVEGGRQERRPGVGVDRILEGVARPGKSRAALGQLLGGKAIERGNCGIPKKLKALVRRNGGDVGGAAQLDEGRVCSRHVEQKWKSGGRRRGSLRGLIVEGVSEVGNSSGRWRGFVAAANLQTAK